MRSKSGAATSPGGSNSSGAVQKDCAKNVCHLAGFEQFGWSGSTKERQKRVLSGVFLNLMLSNSGGAAQNDCCKMCPVRCQVLSNSGAAAPKNGCQICVFWCVFEAGFEQFGWSSSKK